MRKFLLAASAAVLSFVLFNLSFPGPLLRIAARRARKIPGVRVEMGSLGGDLFSGMTVEDLRVRAPGGALTAARARARLDWPGLATGRGFLGSLILEGPVLRLSPDSGAAGPKKSSSPPGAGLPWYALIRRLEVVNGSVSWGGERRRASRTSG